MTEKTPREKFLAFVQEAEKDPEYWAETPSLEFTAGLVQLMREQGVTQEQLAERVGVSQAYVSKVLAGSTRFTLATMTKFSLAFGRVPRLWLAPKEVKRWSVIGLTHGEKASTKVQSFEFDSPSPENPDDWSRPARIQVGT